MSQYQGRVCEIDQDEAYIIIHNFCVIVDRFYMYSHSSTQVNQALYLTICV